MLRHLARSSKTLISAFFFHPYHPIRAPPPPPPPPPPLPLFFLFSTDAAPTFIFQYLIGSCGLSPEEAVKASKPISHLRSPQIPDSVLSFLRGSGFDATQIRRLVSSRPGLLCTDDVEKTIGPKLRFFEEIGFSRSDLVKFFLGNRALFGCSLENRLLPNASLLRECGIPGSRISAFIWRYPRTLMWRTDILRAFIRCVEELGFAPSSVMFEHALHTVCKIGRSTLKVRLTQFGSLGWTEGETLLAIRKAPFLLRFSQGRLKKSMACLVGELGYEPAFVALHPILLMFSLENRVIPRYRVLQVLKSKGICESSCGFLSVVHMSEKLFLYRFILPHEESVPGLREAYVSPCSEAAALSIIMPGAEVVQE